MLESLIPRTITTYHHSWECCTEFGEPTALQTSSPMSRHTVDTSTPSVNGHSILQMLLQLPHLADYNPQEAKGSDVHVNHITSHTGTLVYHILRMCTRLGRWSTRNEKKSKSYYRHWESLVYNTTHPAAAQKLTVVPLSRCPSLGWCVHLYPIPSTSHTKMLVIL